MLYWFQMTLVSCFPESRVIRQYEQPTQYVRNMKRILANNQAPLENRSNLHFQAPID